MEIVTGLIAGIAAFAGAWLAPLTKDKAQERSEIRSHKRQLLADAREAIAWFSRQGPRTSFINDAKYLAIRAYLPDELTEEIEAPFLPGAPIREYRNREQGSPSLDTFRIAVDGLERKWVKL